MPFTIGNCNEIVNRFLENKAKKQTSVPKIIR